MPDDTEIRTQWSEQQVRDHLKEFPHAYQNVRLPYGLETGGIDRHYRGWLDFVKTKSPRQYVVDTSRECKLVPLDQWEAALLP